LLVGHLGKRRRLALLGRLRRRLSFARQRQSLLLLRLEGGQLGLARLLLLCDLLHGRTLKLHLLHTQASPCISRQRGLLGRSVPRRGRFVRRNGR